MRVDPMNSFVSKRPNPPNRPVLPRTARGRLGQQLRALFSDVERDPIPVEQLDLLLELSRRERERRNAASV